MNAEKPNSHRYILISLYCKKGQRNKLGLVLQVLTLLDLCMCKPFPLTISLILPPGGILWEVIVWKKRKDNTWKGDLSRENKTAEQFVFMQQMKLDHCSLHCQGKHEGDIQDKNTRSLRTSRIQTCKQEW